MDILGGQTLDPSLIGNGSRLATENGLVRIKAAWFLYHLEIGQFMVTRPIMGILIFIYDSYIRWVCQMGNLPKKLSVCILCFFYTMVSA